jgi:hypothetical protein
VVGYLVPVPPHALANAFGNGISGLFSGFFGGFMALVVEGLKARRAGLTQVIVCRAPCASGPE